MCDSCLLPLRDLRRFSSGHRRGQPQARRETGFLCHVEETCCVPWATARFYDNNGKNRNFKRHTRLRWIRRYQVWDIHGTTRCGKDYESSNAKPPPDDQKGKHRTHFLPRSVRGLSHSAPAILQGSRSLEHTIPSECLKSCWSSRGHGERSIRYRVGVDGAWERHGIHQEQSRQQIGTCS